MFNSNERSEEHDHTSPSVLQPEFSGSRSLDGCIDFLPIVTCALCSGRPLMQVRVRQPFVRVLALIQLTELTPSSLAYYYSCWVQSFSRCDWTYNRPFMEALFDGRYLVKSVRAHL